MPVTGSVGLLPAPLVAVYRERGILLEVDGMGEVAQVSERILTALRD